MVKRTVVILGILSLMIVASGTSFAFSGAWGDSCAPKPCYVPVECCLYPLPTPVTKTWAINIVGPCPPPGPMCCSKDKCGSSRPGLCASIANIGLPCLDLLFGNVGGVYGCDGGSEPVYCGPCFGPVASILAAVPQALGSATVFGNCW